MTAVSEPVPYPDGENWYCSQCDKEYPENYEPERCESCNGLLTRCIFYIEFVDERKGR